MIRCRQCRHLCQKQLDIEDTPTSSFIREDKASPSCSQQCSHLSSEEESLLKISCNSSRSYGSRDSFDLKSFDEIKDIEEMSLNEYLEGDRHQLSRHIILVLVLSLFSILVS